MLDLVIVSGTVVDGTGAEPVAADVGIRDGRIVAVGAVDEPARRRLDATGLVVAPGFVDLHTHYDAQLLWDPTASPSPLHGVTTVLGGNCGFSIAPLEPEHTDYVRRMMARVEGIPLEALEGGPAWDWRGFGDWLDRLEGRLGVNAGFLVGHSTLRRLAMGADAVGHPATAEQIATMVALTHASIAAGALGLSSSLGEAHTDGDGNPVPSRSARFEEFLALATAVGQHPGTSLEFIPAMGEIPAERIELMADMSLAAGRPLNWNLLGSLSPVEIFAQQLSASDRATERGATVVALALPDLLRMRAGRMFESLPGWAEVMALPDGERVAAVAQAATREALRAGATEAARRGLDVLARFELIEVAEGPLAGRTIAEIAAARGADALDTLIDVVVPERVPLSVAFPSLVPSMGVTDESWRARAAVWKDERVVLGGSDAGAHVDLMCHANYPTVVLANLVRERQLFSLPEAVRALSDVPARLYGLRDRGRIAQGGHADVVVFDPERIDSEPALARHDLPGGGLRVYAGSRGVAHVLVGGTEIVADGSLTDERPGCVLRSGRDTDTVPIPAR